MSTKTVRKVSGFGDVPELKPRTFRIERDGEEFEFAWRPLTFHRTEEIRAKVPRPTPPMKQLELGPKELVLRAQQGLPTKYPDEQDTAYQEELRKYEATVAMETLRLALGWDVDPETFADQAGRLFTKGEIDDFVDQVTQASFNLNPERIQAFLSRFSPSPQTDAASSDTETTSPAKDS